MVGGGSEPIWKAAVSMGENRDRLCPDPAPRLLLSLLLPEALGFQHFLELWCQSPQDQICKEPHGGRGSHGLKVLELAQLQINSIVKNFVRRSQLKTAHKQ